jgi:hypothetical protein
MLSLFAAGEENDAGKESSPTGDESSPGDESPHDDIMERERESESNPVQQIMKMTLVQRERKGWLLSKKLKKKILTPFE